MKFFSFGKSKAAPQESEAKSSIGACGPDASHVDYLMSAFGIGILSSYLSPLLSYRFYHKISPLQGTISKIHDAIGELPVVLRSETEPELLIKDHDVLELLKNPSPLTTKKQFFTSSAKSLMLTRELFIVARGPVNLPPLELAFIHPYNIQIFEDTNSSWPKQIYTNINGDRRYYMREEIKGRFRYIDKMRMNEIFPYISEADVAGDSGYFRGMSPLTSLKDELLSYSASVVGNTASINNSGRPSGIITPEDDELTPEQYEDIDSTLKDNIGAVNSGRLLLLPARVKAAFPQWAPKDMDYETLQSNVKNNVWNLYSMPLPIVSEKGQTYSNFAEAQTAFYDEAVNENWGILADALKWLLETRYDMTGLMVSYNPFEVPALKRRAVSQMAEMTKAEALEVNEIRNSAGYADIPDGDNVMVSAKKTSLSAIIDGASFGTGGAAGANGGTD